SSPPPARRGRRTPLRSAAAGTRPARSWRRRCRWCARTSGSPGWRASGPAARRACGAPWSAPSPSLETDPLGGGAARRVPRQLLRLGLARDAGLDEPVLAGLGQLQRVPLALGADRVRRGRLPVEGHLEDDPRPDLLRHPHPRPPWLLSLRWTMS